MDLLVFFKSNLDLLIVGVLGFMSFLSLWFAVERAYFFANLNLDEYKSQKELELALGKNMTALYLIYTNAPYVGLLGTIAGIMITFYDMANSKAIDASAIMLGLSLALKATFFGIALAIITLVFYNLLARKAEILSAKFEEKIEI